MERRPTTAARWAGNFLVSVAAMLCALVFTSRVEAQGPWVVMVYIAADNEAEADRVQDVLEMQMVGSSTNLDILVQIDRSDARDETIIPGLDGYTSGARRFRVTSGGVSDSTDLGTINSGTQAALTDFVTWGVGLHPWASGTRYALVVSGPGSGWRGTAPDTSASPASTISAQQIRVAAEALDSTTRFDLVAIDGSFFMTLENVADLRGNASGGITEVVGSADETAATGFDYAAWLRSITTATDEEAVATSLVTTYASSMPASNTTWTMAGIHAAQVVLNTAGIVQNLRAGLTAIGTDTATAFPIIRQARAASVTEVYGRSGQSDPYNLVDAAGLFGQIRALDTAGGAWSSPFREAASRIGNAVFVHREGSSHSTAGGISVYLPQKGRLSSDPAASLDRNFQGGTGTPWADFIAAYAADNQSDNTAPDTTGVGAAGDGASPPAGGGLGGRMIHVTATTSGNDIDSVSMIIGAQIAGGTDIAFLGELPVDQGGGGDSLMGGAIDYLWDGSWLGLGDATGAVTPAALFVADRYMAGTTPHAIYATPVRLDTGFDAVTALEYGTLYFDVDLTTLTGTFIGAFSQDDSDTNVDGVTQLLLDTDAMIIPQIPVVTAAGDYTLQDGSASIPVNELEVRAYDVPDGTYDIGYTVTDLVGNTDTQFVSVSLTTPVGADGGAGVDAGARADGSVAPTPASSNCGCAAAGSQQGSAGWALAGLALVALVVRRRRGSKRVS